MTKKKTFTTVIFICFILFSNLMGQYSHAQQPDDTTVSCGTILEAEFTPDTTSQSYTIDLAAGDFISIKVDPIGEFLDPHFDLIGPEGGRLRRADVGRAGVSVEMLDVEVSASGLYTITLYSYNGLAGAYTLEIGCTLRDGTVIAPGDAQNVVPDSPGSSDSGSTFSGFGFPGLPPVDFANMVTTSIQPNNTIEGEIPAAFDGVLGYTIALSAGDTIKLGFERISGNLNLGLVMLTEEGYVVFQASLITTESLSTQFPVLLPGAYTIGIFRINLSPPPAPEATMFAISVVIVK